MAKVLLFTNRFNFYKSIKTCLKHIRKEANNLNLSMIRDALVEDTNEYVNDQKRIRDAIANLTLKMALEIGIDEREYYRLKAKLKSDKPRFCFGFVG